MNLWGHQNLVIIAYFSLNIWWHPHSQDLKTDLFLWTCFDWWQKCKDKFLRHTIHSFLLFLMTYYPIYPAWKTLWWHIIYPFVMNYPQWRLHLSQLIQCWYVPLLHKDHGHQGSIACRFHQGLRILKMTVRMAGDGNLWLPNWGTIWGLIFDIQPHAGSHLYCL